jgi:4,5-DOPA dioxygenase extradiol
MNIFVCDKNSNDIINLRIQDHVFYYSSSYYRESMKSEDTLPVLFIGHGSPMNVIADNTYTRDLQKVRKGLPAVKAIVVISAHWLTRGTLITGSARPQQIFDFYGFPEELYRVNYNAPGSPVVAQMLCDLAGDAGMEIDPDRGIDHAAWVVLRHLYPEQQMPVLELSLDIEKDPSWHYHMGKKLKEARKEGILFIGSGNIVHNLRRIRWEENAEPFPWAVRFDQQVKEALDIGDHQLLIHFDSLGEDAMMAIPTNEHYLPMLYVLGMMDPGEKIKYIHESIQNGSISMRSFRSIVEHG